MTYKLLINCTNGIPNLSPELLDLSFYSLNPNRLNALVTINCSEEEFQTLNKTELSDQEAKIIVKDWDKQLNLPITPNLNIKEIPTITPEIDELLKKFIK